MHVSNVSFFVASLDEFASVLATTASSSAIAGRGGSGAPGSASASSTSERPTEEVVASSASCLCTGPASGAADHRRLEAAEHRREHTRENLAMRAGRTCDADSVVTVIEAFVAERPVLGHLPMDNGPKLIAWALQAGASCPVRPPDTRAGSPRENLFIESFNGPGSRRAARRLEFATLLETQVAWCVEHKTYQAHSSLAGLTPPSTPRVAYQPASALVAAGPANGVPFTPVNTPVRLALVSAVCNPCSGS